MRTNGRRRSIAARLLTGLALLSLSLGAPAWSEAQSASSTVEQSEVASFIVQGSEMDAVAEAVREVGGTVTRELAIINAVGAELTSAQRDQLSEHPAVDRVVANGNVEVTGPPDANYHLDLIDVDELHQSGIDLAP